MLARMELAEFLLKTFQGFDVTVLGTHRQLHTVYGYQALTVQRHPRRLPPVDTQAHDAETNRNIIYHAKRVSARKRGISIGIKSPSYASAERNRNGSAVLYLTCFSAKLDRTSPMTILNSPTVPLLAKEYPARNCTDRP